MCLEVGSLLGCAEGWWLGCTDGCIEGKHDGCDDGAAVGCLEGCLNGWVLGCIVDCIVGCDEGCENTCPVGGLSFGNAILILLFCKLAISRLPCESITIFVKLLNKADLASPWSPANPFIPTVPAMVYIYLLVELTILTRALPVSDRNRFPLPLVSIAMLWGLFSWAFIANPPSPLNPRWYWM
jgi:hypothetical protein